MCKAALATETATIAEYLQPWQLAVGVAGGVEALPHAARAWRDQHAADVDRYLA